MPLMESNIQLLFLIFSNYFFILLTSLANGCAKFMENVLVLTP